jgi:hypothetical protein
MTMQEMESTLENDHFHTDVYTTIRHNLTCKREEEDNGSVVANS